MIYKTWFGKYIDLSKVVSISEAHQCEGQWRLGFEIYCQLLERPIKYRTWWNSAIKDGYEITRKELQQKIDDMVKVWKDFKESQRSCDNCANFTGKGISICDDCGEIDNIYGKHAPVCNYCEKTRIFKVNKQKS